MLGPEFVFVVESAHWRGAVPGKPGLGERRMRREQRNTLYLTGIRQRHSLEHQADYAKRGPGFDRKHLDRHCLVLSAEVGEAHINQLAQAPHFPTHSDSSSRSGRGEERADCGCCSPRPKLRFVSSPPLRCSSQTFVGYSRDFSSQSCCLVGGNRHLLLLRRLLELLSLGGALWSKNKRAITAIPSNSCRVETVYPNISTVQLCRTGAKSERWPLDSEHQVWLCSFPGGATRLPPAVSLASLLSCVRPRKTLSLGPTKAGSMLTTRPPAWGPAGVCARKGVLASC
ncbi:hypothetical protein VTI74DRAFT_5512 [Chaetomium olivicolor]